ncbi:uncharacterized protein E0L32_001679 [Thyridium curvatum]|uniref:Protein kinase domain-containing protein n=1 Tax=Thyridium curvatum TaxID=1093900 RepID=A0A507AVS9_9PEZI|nr:uncharacterized protein E0L32_001519 [Thyridium curvatum]XP_030990930.1 uncharacterized protein E0L32_001679 [Thyridium curvatum]TPX09059.1 hypothetical protein E0L32_001519 [Thyridium curvatum]TPX09219.1 hypothetical protein E0L32_001679 [Thyridium curvatum]
MSDQQSEVRTPFPGYQQGQELQLQFTAPGQPTRQIAATILRVKEPFTCSVALVVGMILNNNPEVFFLKLYDHRFSHGMRAQFEIGPYTPEIATAFNNFVQTGGADAFGLHLTGQVHLPGVEGSEFTPEQDEIFVTKNLDGLYLSEVGAYDGLQASQGVSIPRFMGTCVLDATPPGYDSHEYFQIEGIVTQFLPGFSLEDLPHYAPRGLWQEIVDAAVAVTREVDAADMLNMDTRPDNFIVVPHLEGGFFKTYMIDLAMCVRRREGQTDEQWGREKWWRNEEGCVGEAMQHILSQHDFELRFERSDKYDAYAHLAEAEEDGDGVEAE